MKCPKCGGNRTPEHCNLCELFATGETLPGTNPAAKWPLASTALAVHPDQVPEANERAKKHGISVQYDKGGRVHIPDVRNYRKLLKLERMVNRDSFYG